MSDELRALRLSKNIPGRDMVDIVKPLYPKFDKTILSKCENGDAYGVDLRKDALNALYKHFDPEGKMKPKKKDAHRLNCRISCRLETELYNKLVQMLEGSPYKTMQELLTAVITEYIRKAGDTYGTGNTRSSRYPKS